MNLTERRIGWIKKLRSGKYLQGRNCLYSIDNGTPEHCCIGVYLDDNVTWKPSAVLKNDNRTELYGSFQEDLDIGPEFQTHLISMNDEHGRDFSFIARFLEVAWKL